MRPNFNCACSSSEHLLAVLGPPLPTCHLASIYMYVLTCSFINIGDKLKKKKKKKDRCERCVCVCEYVCTCVGEGEGGSEGGREGEV